MTAVKEPEENRAAVERLRPGAADEGAIEVCMQAGMGWAACGGVVEWDTQDGKVPGGMCSQPAHVLDGGREVGRERRGDPYCL